MTGDDDQKRQWFNGYVTRHGSGVIELERDYFWYTCPCCGYPTLPERNFYHICSLCNWEDDGQGDAEADKVWGGPNGGYSLTEARQNFKQYWIMYRPDNNTRITRGDSERMLAAKKAMVQAFDTMIGAGDLEQARLWTVVAEARAKIDQELHQRLQEYQQGIVRQ